MRSPLTTDFRPVAAGEVDVRLIAPWGQEPAGAVVTVSETEAERLVQRGMGERLDNRYVTKSTEGLVIKSFGPAVVKAGDDDRRWRVIASDATLDRGGDIVDPAGWKIPAHVPFLFSHDRTQPVGRAVNIEVAAGRLLATCDFLPAGIDPTADRVAGMVRHGTLAAVSVGFMPLEREPRRDGSGWVYRKAELWEVSWVAVPANPSAGVVGPAKAQAEAVDRIEAKLRAAGW
jgi:HK97 family phage prohead protease